MTSTVGGRWLREPLLHFFAVGALFFGAYGVLHLGTADSRDEIVVSRGQLQNLKLQFERVWQRPATEPELRTLVDNFVKEEIFYREGITLGLDRDDPVVRRRVGQKLEFIVESAAPPPPSEAELQAWLATHAEQYRIEPNYSLQQVYFDPARHGDLDVVIAAAKRALDAGRTPAGDATMLPATLEYVAATETQRVFGAEFADALETLPVGGWQGPIRSAFGLHLVTLTQRSPARAATLTEARGDVERDLTTARLRDANASFYDSLRAKYAVRIENGPATDPG